jgi:hypothetical protein
VVPRFRMVKRYKKNNVNASDCMDVRYEGKKKTDKISTVRYYVVKPCFVWIRTYPKRPDPEPNLMVKSEVKGGIVYLLGKKL